MDLRDYVVEIVNSWSGEGHAVCPMNIKRINMPIFEVEIPDWGVETTQEAYDAAEAAENVVERKDDDRTAVGDGNEVNVLVRKKGEVEWKRFMVVGEQCINYTAYPG